MPIKVGDHVDVKYMAERGIYQSKGTARVMAIAEGHAMLRIGGCMPFIERVKDLERWNPQESEA